MTEEEEWAYLEAAGWEFVNLEYSESEVTYTWRKRTDRAWWKAVSSVQGLADRLCANFYIREDTKVDVHGDEYRVCYEWLLESKFERVSEESIEADEE